MSSFKKFQEDFCTFITTKESDESLEVQITPVGKLSSQGVLSVYKDDYFARLTEALGSTFEVTWEVLGDDDFLRACRKFISRNPSPFYSLGDYGHNFPLFLKEEGFNEEVLFASDLAQFEWSFWQVFHSSLNKRLIRKEVINELMMEDRPFLFSDEVTLIKFDFKIGSLWQNRKELGNFSVNDFVGPENLALFRSLIGVSTIFLSDEEFVLVDSLRKNGRWSSATMDLEFLINWSQEQWAIFFNKVVLFLKET